MQQKLTGKIITFEELANICTQLLITLEEEELIMMTVERLNMFHISRQQVMNFVDLKTRTLQI